MKALITILFVCFILCGFSQHNSTYSQYMFNGLLLNPAYAGSKEALDATALYRKQWVGLDGAPSTITFSAHTPLNNKKINLGLILVNDKFGITEHTTASLIYAYRFKLFKGNMSLGLLVGIDSYKVNWNKIRATQNDDPSFTAINTEKRIIPQAGFGMYYYSNKIFVGLSVPNFYSSPFNTYKTVVFNGGGLIKVSNIISIKPALLIRYIQGSTVNATLSSTFYWKTILGLGVGYTHQNSMLAYLDLKVNDQFRLGYAYEYATTHLNRYSSGSHEIMLRYLFHYKINALSSRYF